MKKSNSDVFPIIKNFYICNMQENVVDGINMAELNMEYNGEIPELCPKCGSLLYKHGFRSLEIVDTPLFAKPTRLLLNYPRKRCKNCQFLWKPELEEIDEKRNMTTRAFANISNQSLKRSFEDIAEEYAINSRTVKNTFIDFLQDKYQTIRFETPAFLGLDEIKIKKLGEVTVITDLEHKTLYDMLLGRNQTSLTDYFSTIPNPERVLWVCTDMYRPFEKTIRNALPNARWVVDHFHIVAYANRAMDSVRVEVQDHMTRKNRIKTKKGLAYTLRTRQRNLSNEEASKIRLCRTIDECKPLAVAFDLKEDFFNIYDNNLASKDGAMQAFEDWEKSIPAEDMYEGFRDLANTVHNFYEQIFNFWDCPIQITNGFTECTNRIIRENNVRGRGNSFEVLRGRTLYRKTNLENAKQSGILLGPEIPKNGPIFHFEEVKGISDIPFEYDSEYSSSFDYDPLIGLIPGKDYDPETGEIFDDIFEDDDEE